MTRHETEPLGITYDRLRLDGVLRDLVSDRGVREAIEMPTAGAKAMPGIYSLALARAGADVTLLNPDPRGLAVWERLGLTDRLTSISAPGPTDTGAPSRSFDLAWNFVTAAFEPSFPSVVREMARVSQRFVMTVHCNAFNYGYPWHRFLHRVLDLEWTHGETQYFFPKEVRRVYREAGLEPIDFGLFDMPWWPDPPGFRDVRLHLSGADVSGGDEGEDDVAWHAPIEDVYRTGHVPLPIRVLSRIEDLPFPRWVRFPFSHLFYILGERILR